ncbi:hypothetical protein MTR67_025455 [Solanum verrucosum]|uniref:Uncharacterized protein n=1 Tax=Solanum verrucosum TaxID=315347 RepID=A0AAF0R3K5_SOLVR|nr:hypothetical protein MTR67_025455 [Solanum verrucosum]
MGRLFLVYYDEYPKEDFFHCIICKTRIGFVNKFIDYIDDYGITAVFHNVFNAQVDAEKYHRQSLITIKLRILEKEDYEEEEEEEDDEEDDGGTTEQDHDQVGETDEHDHHNDGDVNEHDDNDQD